MASKSSRTPSRFDLWVAGHPAVFVALGCILGACAWLIWFLRPDSEGPLRLLALLLPSASGVMFVLPFMVRKRVRAELTSAGPDSRNETVPEKRP